MQPENGDGEEGDEVAPTEQAGQVSSAISLLGDLDGRAPAQFGRDARHQMPMIRGGREQAERR